MKTLRPLPDHPATRTALVRFLVITPIQVAALLLFSWGSLMIPSAPAFALACAIAFAPYAVFRIWVWRTPGTDGSTLSLAQSIRTPLRVLQGVLLLGLLGIVLMMTIVTSVVGGEAAGYLLMGFFGLLFPGYALLGGVVAFATGVVALGRHNATSDPSQHRRRRMDAFFAPLATVIVLIAAAVIFIPTSHYSDRFPCEITDPTSGKVRTVQLMVGLTMPQGLVLPYGVTSYSLLDVWRGHVREVSAQVQAWCATPSQATARYSSCATSCEAGRYEDVLDPALVAGYGGDFAHGYEERFGGSTRYYQSASQECAAACWRKLYGLQ